MEYRYYEQHPYIKIVKLQIQKWPVNLSEKQIQASVEEPFQLDLTCYFPTSLYFSIIQ